MPGRSATSPRGQIEGQSWTWNPRMPWICISIMLSGLCLLTAEAEVAKADQQPASLKLEFRSGASRLELRGRDARQQVLVTADYASGAERDCTREVTYSSAPAGIVSVDPTGMVRALGDGDATLTAKTANGLTATLPVAVEDYGRMIPV